MMVPYTNGKTTDRIGFDCMLFHESKPHMYTHIAKDNASILMAAIPYLKATILQHHYLEQTIENNHGCPMIQNNVFTLNSLKKT